MTAMHEMIAENQAYEQQIKPFIKEYHECKYSFQYHKVVLERETLDAIFADTLFFPSPNHACNAVVLVISMIETAERITQVRYIFLIQPMGETK